MELTCEIIIRIFLQIIRNSNDLHSTVFITQGVFMNINRILLIGAMMTLGANALFARGNPETVSDGKPIVVVSILPQAYFVERIAGTRVTPLVLVGPGQSPHAYEPTPRQMAELSKAALWLTIDSEFETALKPKVAALYKDLSVVDTTVGIEYRSMESHQHEGEAEAGHTDDEEEGKDPHVWLGRQAVKAMAANIREALSAFDPAGAALYSKNHDAFIDDVDTVFDSLKTILAPLEGKPVFVYHPAFGYFLDEFGIEQEDVETGGKEPTQKTLAVLIEEARADEAKVIFVQAQFPTSAAQTVATAIGGVVVSIDPLAPDWMENIKRIGAALTKAIK